MGFRASCRKPPCGTDISLPSLLEELNNQRLEPCIFHELWYLLHDILRIFYSKRHLEA